MCKDSYVGLRLASAWPALGLGALMMTLFVCLVSGPTRAAPGDSDASFAGFGNHGVSTIGTFQVLDMLVQPDGKILLLDFDTNGGNLLLFRMLPNGEGADPAFGTFGRLDIPNASFGFFRAIALQADGKILAVGDTSDGDFLIARLNPNGTMDGTWGFMG